MTISCYRHLRRPSVISCVRRSDVTHILTQFEFSKQQSERHRTWQNFPKTHFDLVEMKTAERNKIHLVKKTSISGDIIADGRFIAANESHNFDDLAAKQLTEQRQNCFSHGESLSICHFFFRIDELLNVSGIHHTRFKTRKRKIKVSRGSFHQLRINRPKQVSAYPDFGKTIFSDRLRRFLHSINFSDHWSDVGNGESWRLTILMGSEQRSGPRKQIG